MGEDRFFSPHAGEGVPDRGAEGARQGSRKGQAGEQEGPDRAREVSGGVPVRNAGQHPEGGVPRRGNVSGSDTGGRTAWNR